MNARFSRLFASVSAVALISVAGLAVGTTYAQPEAQPGTRQPERRPGGEGRRPGAEGRGEGMNVEGAMKTMNRSLKQLNGQIADAAKKDDNLKLIGDMERAIVAAKNQPVPADVLAKAKDDAAKAKVSSEFRSHLIDALRKIIDVEEAVADGKTDDAKAKLALFAKTQEAGHNAVGLKDD